MQTFVLFVRLHLSILVHIYLIFNVACVACCIVCAACVVCVDVSTQVSTYVKYLPFRGDCYHPQLSQWLGRSPGPTRDAHSAM